jgi:hypothetical protein
VASTVAGGENRARAAAASTMAAVASTVVRQQLGRCGGGGWEDATDWCGSVRGRYLPKWAGPF